MQKEKVVSLDRNSKTSDSPLNQHGIQSLPTTCEECEHVMQNLKRLSKRKFQIGNAQKNDDIFLNSGILLQENILCFLFIFLILK